MENYETLLLLVKQVFIYKIPPRTTSKGVKAADWDVNAFLWTGRMRVLQVNDDTCTLVFEDSKTGELFASCPYTSSSVVEQVTDSSRYFVIKIVDKVTGQHAFVGLGFPERSWAFDFQVALQEFLKYVFLFILP
jgi:hypothetical protein